MGFALPRLHVVTDCRAGRDPLAVVRAAVTAATDANAAHELAIQVRVEDATTDADAYRLTLDVLFACVPAGVTVLVNDRVHVGLATEADGAHVGADDLPAGAARAVLGTGALLGATCRTAEAGRAAEAAGASYLGVGPYRATTTKSGLPAAIGGDGVAAVTGAVPGTPVVAIGGITVSDVAELRRVGAHAVAVVGAVSGAADPRRAVGELLHAVTHP
jgi:thiamine-phosphate pyrophosphorylase